MRRQWLGLPIEGVSVSVVWIFWSLMMLPVGGNVGAHIDQREGWELTPRIARLNLLVANGMLVVLFVMFVLGFPGPGDMREMDDTTWGRILIFGMSGTGLGLDLVQSEVFHDVYSLRPMVPREERDAVKGPILFVLVGQLGVAVMAVVAFIRGFSDTPIGYEYHWWLFVFAVAEMWFVFYYSRRPRTDRRVLSVGFVVLLVVVSGFFLQPLGFAPSG